jgi:heat shock protein HslJ
MIQAITLALMLLQSATPQQPATRQSETPPYAGAWVITVIDNIKVMPDSRVTLNVTGTTVTGLASCNSYRGSFTVDGQTVKVGEFLKTMKACDPPRMSQEADFLALLRAVVRYEVRSTDTLILTTAAGKTITATRSKAPSNRQQ